MPSRSARSSGRGWPWLDVGRSSRRHVVFLAVARRLAAVSQHRAFRAEPLFFVQRTLLHYHAPLVLPALESIDLCSSVRRTRFALAINAVRARPPPSHFAPTLVCVRRLTSRPSNRRRGEMISSSPSSSSLVAPPTGYSPPAGLSHLANGPSPVSTTRILELSNFSQDLKTRDIQGIFAEWEDDRGGFKIKWVDDTSCLIVFGDAGVGASMPSAFWRRMLTSGGRQPSGPLSPRSPTSLPTSLTPATRLNRLPSSAPTPAPTSRPSLPRSRTGRARGATPLTRPTRRCPTAGPARTHRPPAEGSGGGRASACVGR